MSLSLSKELRHKEAMQKYYLKNKEKILEKAKQKRCYMVSLKPIRFLFIEPEIVKPRRTENEIVKEELSKAKTLKEYHKIYYQIFKKELSAYGKQYYTAHKKVTI